MLGRRLRDASSAPVRLAVVGFASFLLFPFVGHGVLYDVWYLLYGIAVLGAFAVGVHRHRPSHLFPWLVLAGGIAASVAGDFVYLVSDALTLRLAYPSIADALYLASYPLLALGLLAMLRSRAPGRDRTSVIDAAILTSGAAAVSWAFLIQPLTTGTDTLTQKLVSIAYPLMDILLLAVAARMIVIGGLRTRAYTLLLGAIIVQLAGDSLYGIGSLQGWYANASWVDLVTLTSYLLWGAAVLDSSMVTLTEPQDDPEIGLTHKRLAGLVAAAMLAPAMIVYEAATGTTAAGVGLRCRCRHRLCPRNRPARDHRQPPRASRRPGGVIAPRRSRSRRRESAC